ncbi:hypothetical protein SERLADRAFT_402397 [Serpula lacrymans var. lacrymans S7.9]|uniref:Uncharacterized protein n=1 Tax=Serpula lacrymans var. lacrymans (strain S7.9) TaxID=578457 RepID=F8PBS5_SERL9|nr:uncharacterized protein SERLADRAFT_402397 [Serpula lacrymans var. lacrymans S7.9]EGO19713.1 hypothetical protein SERLADRAFT_402397 [Serpula lacrymans var. lacrymans S7.9]
MSSKPDDAHQSSTSVNNLQTQVSSLQFELSELQRRYDALLEAKERAAARYKLDYKKWRDFKRLMYADDKEDRARRPLDAHKDSRVHGKRKRFEEMGPNVDAFEDEEDEDSMELEKVCSFLSLYNPGFMRISFSP